MNPRGLLFDCTKCIGCRQCIVACKESHGLPSEIDADLSATTYTVVKKMEGAYIRRLCMHCLVPTCASACPVTALEKLPQGPVIYDASKCMGCRYCIMACPFRVPAYEWDSPNPKVRKCDFCYQRQLQGKGTMCSWVCPTGATRSGSREELLNAAKERIHRQPREYRDHVYGEAEIGGTSVLLIADRCLCDLGYPGNLADQPLANLTWTVLEKLPNLVITGGLLLGGLWWIVNRRIELGATPEQKIEEA